MKISLQSLAVLAVSFVGPAICVAAEEAAAPTNAGPRLLPARAELPPTFWEQNSVTVVIVSCIALLLIAGLVWLLTRPKVPESVAPGLLARRDLDSLDRNAPEGLLLSEISQIMRRYLLSSFELPPGEFTTTEFSKLLGTCEKVSPDFAATVREFLLHCDERKFAPSTTRPPLDAFSQARELIDVTELQLEKRRLQEEEASKSGSAVESVGHGAGIDG